MLCVYIDNGGEVVVDLDSFATFNSISTQLAKEVATRKVSVNESMREFINHVNIDLGEFDSNVSQEKLESNWFRCI